MDAAVEVPKMREEMPNRRPEPANKLGNALFLLERIDNSRDLHGILSTLSFFVSALVAVRSFFWLIDLTTWLGLDEFDPVAPASVSFVLIFVIWIVCFLMLLSVLEAMGVKGVRQTACAGLSSMALEREELCMLRDLVASRQWKHARIFNSVLADLVDGRQVT